ncbi:MAG: HAD hydrolase-like protein [Alphaproteobacteria bacterium]|nr:HAD hydrolase-like protein [Alphaproteobacteria bacterium]
MKIFLDLDGTIISCKNKQTNLLRIILQQNEFQGLIKDNVMNNFLNNWWELKKLGNSTKQALIHLGINEYYTQKINEIWINKIENIEISYLDNVFPDFYDFSNICNKKNIKLYLLTARNNLLILRQSINRFNLINYFSKIYVVKHKNLIENKFEILKKYSADYFIGDTETDYLSAIKANIKFIGSTRGQRCKTYLSTYGVNNFFNNFNDLNYILK